MYSYQLIVLFFLSVYSTSAFSPPCQKSSEAVTIWRHCRSMVSFGAATTDTSLYFKDLPEDDLTSFTTNTIQQQQQQQQHVEQPPPAPSHPELYLPRHSEETRGKFQLGLQDAELYVGRIAMLTAILLLSVEISTGESLPDQLARYFG
jgi:hypothetical protein